ncbi:hypothetical protein ACN20G_04700 [Streptomyces sp. BI20]|uniref:hypothetical protein n=1 Tax=Streptomyces sp. BI20 TaxID=3403460 RepID=UPI003C7116EC
MFTAAAVCPAAPLLVPEVAAGAASELDDLRRAVVDALGVLAAARPDRLVVVASAEAARAGEYPEGSPGSFRGFGITGPAAEVRLGPAGDLSPAARTLPTGLAVGAWLLDHVAWAGAPVTGLAVADTATPQECAALGADLAGSAGRVALLVLGDGSARRTLKAPGYLDDRAAAHDAAAAAALGSADTAALAALDPNLAHELLVDGRAPWQVLAGAAAPAAPAGRLLYEDAPYGVGYLVATWS